MNFLTKLYKSTKCPYGKLPIIHRKYNNITKIHWSLIKAPIINHLFTDTQQIHRYMTTFIQWLLHHSTIVPNQNSVPPLSRVSSRHINETKLPLYTPKYIPFTQYLWSVMVSLYEFIPYYSRFFSSWRSKKLTGILWVIVVYSHRSYSGYISHVVQL